MKDKEKYIKLKAWLATASFISAIAFGCVALFLPPQGIIDASVLWFTSQTLVFSATLLGFSISMDNLKQAASSISPRKENENEESV